MHGGLARGDDFPTTGGECRALLSVHCEDLVLGKTAERRTDVFLLDPELLGDLGEREGPAFLDQSGDPLLVGPARNAVPAEIGDLEE